MSHKKNIILHSAFPQRFFAVQGRSLKAENFLRQTSVWPAITVIESPLSCSSDEQPVFPLLAKQKGRLWVHLIPQARDTERWFRLLIQELKSYHNRFQTWFRMSAGQSECLLRITAFHLRMRRTEDRLLTVNRGKFKAQYNIEPSYKQAVRDQVTHCLLGWCLSWIKKIQLEANKKCHHFGWNH